MLRLRPLRLLLQSDCFARNLFAGVCISPTPEPRPLSRDIRSCLTVARKFVFLNPTPLCLISALHAILAEVSSIMASIGHTHGHVRACLCCVSQSHSFPKGKWKKKLLVKDAIADVALQQVLTRPEGEYNTLASARACV
jgi:hypothetical protein